MPERRPELVTGGEDLALRSDQTSGSVDGIHYEPETRAEAHTLEVSDQPLLEVSHLPPEVRKAAGILRFDPALRQEVKNRAATRDHAEFRQRRFDADDAVLNRGGAGGDDPVDIRINQRVFNLFGV